MLDVLPTPQEAMMACLPPVAPLRHTGVAALADPFIPWSNEHDRQSRDRLAGRVAALLGLPLSPPVGPEAAGAARLFLIPGDTIGADVAATAGIRGPDDLLGGVVPVGFIGTKAITHPLVDAAAARPPAWSTRMTERMGDAALNGFTAFSLADAKRAGERLLALGSVRLKAVRGKAGLGQEVAHDRAELHRLVDAADAAEIAEFGLVLEENLLDVVTYGIGTVALGGREISYWGGQNLTCDHQGREVYAGSDLFVVPGDLQALAALPAPPELQRAIACAAAFDAAAQASYPGLLLTRRNYDVIGGTDGAGRRRIGVLEQSWRVGGASGAEIAAFEAFRDEPGLAMVRCSTVEVYGLVEPPAGATVYYRGEDPVVGPMTKYTMRWA